MTIAKFLIGVGLAGAAIGAQAAITYNATAGQNSLQAVTATITFDDMVLPTGFASYDNAAALIAHPGDPSYAAQPPLDPTAFFSVGVTHGQPSSSSVTFGGFGVLYFGFYMGSPDNYNQVTLYSGNTSLGTFTGTQMAAAAGVPVDGNQGVGFYMNFYTNSAAITKVTFSASQDAFESDNHSYIAAPIPEPETYAMLLAGLGLIGAWSRRRSRRSR